MNLSLEQIPGQYRWWRVSTEIQLTLRDRGSGKTLMVHQGQAVGESVDDVHRGESGDEPTVLLITYAGIPGVPTSVPAKGENPEY
jgi:hypothetical protein